MRYKNSQWQDFHSHLEELKLQWIKTLPHSRRQNLLLIGGSGGYAQSEKFLESFQTVTHIDIDPLAAYFFKKNYPNLPTHFLQQSVFDSALHIHPDFLQRFQKENSTWVWCNLLGQQGFHHSEDQVKRLLENVRLEMTERSWMSFHDLFSLRLKKRPSSEFMSKTFENWKDVERHLQDLNESRMSLNDHLTQNVFNFEKSVILPWPLTPKQIHFVECGFTSAASDGATSR